jgi:paraquat-inducible protein A
LSGERAVHTVKQTRSVFSARFVKFAVPVTACPECDLLQREPPAPAGGRVRCARCRAFLYRRAGGGLDRALAFAVTAALLFFIANGAPMAGLTTPGDRTSATVVGTVRTLRAQGAPDVAAVVLATAFLMPAIEIGVTLYLLLSLRRRSRGRGIPTALRVLHAARPWSMVDVLVLGVLVAVGRLGEIARVHLGVGLWAFGFLMLMLAAIPTGFDLRELAGLVRGRPTATGAP